MKDTKYIEQLQDEIEYLKEEYINMLSFLRRNNLYNKYEEEQKKHGYMTPQ